MASYARGNPAQWWRSRSWGLASRAPGGTVVGRFRRLIGMCLLALLLLLSFGIWYVTNPTRMAMLAETLLSRVLGGHVTVQSAHLSLNGTLLLSGIELQSEPVATGVAGAPPKRLPVFSADQIEARFNWLSLLSGQLTATQLTAARSTLYLVEDVATGKWNYECLHKAPSERPSGGSASSSPLSLPVILLREARVTFAEVHAGHIEETAQSIVDGQLSPEPNLAGIYRWQVMRHEEGDAGSTVSPAAQLASRRVTAQPLITGTWDVAHNRFSAIAEEVPLADSLKRALPRQVRNWWDEHHLTGSLSELRLDFDPSDGLVMSMGLNRVSLLMSFQPRAIGAAAPRTFDVPLTNVRGDLTFGITKPSLKLSRLTGRILTYNFQADADFRGTSPESPFDLTLRFRNAFLSRDYPALFMAIDPVQDLFERTGAWGNFDLNLSIKRLSWDGKIFLDGTLTCRDAHLRFCHFPYPLDRLNGQIHFDNDDVTFKNVTAMADEAPVLMTGSLGANAQNHNVDFTVSSTAATFDDRMSACLPEKFQQIWNQFAVRGQGQFVCHVFHRDEPNERSTEPAITVDVTLDDGRGYMRSLSYPFSHATGQIHFAADQTTLDHLTLHCGADGSGRIVLDGLVKHPGGDVSALKPDLHVKADVPVDNALLTLFPPRYAAPLAGGALAGRATFDGTVRRNENPAADAFPAQIVGDLTLKNATLKTRDGGFALDDLSADAHIDTTRLDLRRATAVTPEGVHLSANGTADIAAGSAKLNLAAQGRDIVLPTNAPAALPENMRHLWATYKPAGKIDLDATARLALGQEAAATGPAAAPPIENRTSKIENSLEEWNVSLTAKSLALHNPAWPDAITGITGSLSATPTRITLKDIHAVSGPMVLDFGGDWAPQTGACHLHGAAGSDGVPRKWLSKLPAEASGFIAATKPAGQFKLSLDHLSREAAGQPWNFAGTFSISDLTSAGPLFLGAKRLSIKADNGTYDSAAPALDLKGVLAGTGVTVSGKTLDTLTASVVANGKDKSIKFTDIDGKVAGGALQGSIVAYIDKNPRYQAELSLSDAELSRLMLPPTATDEERKKVGTGRVTATLAVQQAFGNSSGNNALGAGRTGRGDLVIRDGKIYNVPLAMGLMQLVTFRLPIAGAFDRATMSYYLRDDKVTFERILLESPGINLAGMGTLSLKETPPTLDLNFVTESPNEFRFPLLSDLIEQTRNQLLQISVTGKVDNPKITPIPLNPIAATLQAILPHRTKTPPP